MSRANESRTVRDVLLRPTAEAELGRLSDLTEAVYGIRREPRVLRWLLFEGDGEPEVESLVAERRGRIVGHVALLHCHYRVHGRIVVGTHRMLWMVEEGSRGAAGVPLAGRTPDTDFEIVLGGTAATKAMLVMRGFREVGEALELRLQTGGGVSSVQAGVRLAPYEPQVEAPAAPADVLVNAGHAAHLRWLAACPEHDGRLFALERDGTPLGPALVYINRAVDPPTGRIVHVPYVEDRAGAVLAAVLHHLAAEGCEEASLLATDRRLLAAAESLGGEVFYRRPLWFRNPRGAVAPARFHLTYMEGDLSYRRV